MSTVSEEGQTWFGFSGRNRMHDPSLSQSLSLFSCYVEPSAPPAARSARRV